MRTPEFYFAKHFDNSRLVKASDPVRVREMRVFSAAVAVLFSLIMVYGLQHFYAIESSYRVESEKQALDQLREENRQLRLTRGRAHAAGPHRQMARQLGLAEPQPGQVVHPSASSDPAAPALAQITPPPPALKSSSSFSYQLQLSACARISHDHGFAVAEAAECGTKLKL